MKAILCHQFGSPIDLTLSETPNPIPKEEEVLIRVNYAGLNFPDLLMIQGKYQFRPPFPFSPGMELVGEVEAVGKAVSHFAIGDKVIAFNTCGAFAEKIVVPQLQVFALPKEVEMKFAAGLLYTYGTTFHALKDRGRLQADETILVLGASGGIGTAAIELAKFMGAKVIAAASSDEKLELCRKKGADFVVNYSTENLKDKVKSLGACNVILDPVGGAISEQAFRTLKYDGRHLVIGFASGEIPSLRWNLPLLKTSSIVGVFWTDFRTRFPEKNRVNIEQLLQFFRVNLIKPSVEKVFKLSEVPQAMQLLKDRKILGKAVIKVS